MNFAFQRFLRSGIIGPLVAYSGLRQCWSSTGGLGKRILPSASEFRVYHINADRSANLYIQIRFCLANLSARLELKLETIATLE